MASSILVWQELKKKSSAYFSNFELYIMPVYKVSSYIRQNFSSNGMVLR